MVGVVIVVIRKHIPLSLPCALLVLALALVLVLPWLLVMFGFAGGSQCGRADSAKDGAETSTRGQKTEKRVRKNKPLGRVDIEGIFCFVFFSCPVQVRNPRYSF